MKVYSTLLQIIKKNNLRISRKTAVKRLLRAGLISEQSHSPLKCAKAEGYYKMCWGGRLILWHEQKILPFLKMSKPNMRCPKCCKCVPCLTIPLDNENAKTRNEVKLASLEKMRNCFTGFYRERQCSHCNAFFSTLEVSTDELTRFVFNEVIPYFKRQQERESRRILQHCDLTLLVKSKENTQYTKKSK